MSAAASRTGEIGTGEIGTDWRVVAGVATAWFEAPSLAAGTALAERVLELAPDALVDVRTTGVRVRLDAVEHAEAVSAAARETGLSPDPSVLQALGIVLESPDPSTVTPFWQRVLDYAPGEDGALTDPQRRDPALRVRQSGESRPLRQRIHLDVVRPASAVAQADLGEPTGPYGVRLADADGNEVDLVPGDAIGDDPGTSDWRAVFGAMACYRVDSLEQLRDLALAAAVLADDAGFPLLIDLRPGLVVLDSGKDQWEADAHGLDVDFPALAARIQAAARELSATADPALPRLVQLFLDAADVAAVRAFWAAALGYAHDRRDGLTDLVDPRRLGPVLAFQDIDTSETERLRQRNRFEIELAVPGDVAPARVDAAVAAGGRVLEAGDGRWRVADPEGNELVVVAGA